MAQTTHQSRTPPQNCLRAECLRQHTQHGCVDVSIEHHGVPAGRTRGCAQQRPCLGGGFSACCTRLKLTGLSPGAETQTRPVSYTHLRAHETDSYLVCRLLLEKKKKKTRKTIHRTHK